MILNLTNGFLFNIEIFCTAIEFDNGLGYGRTGFAGQYNEGFDVTFVVDQTLASRLGPLYRTVVQSIVKQVCDRKKFIFDKNFDK